MNIQGIEQIGFIPSEFGNRANKHSSNKNSGMDKVSISDEAFAMAREYYSNGISMIDSQDRNNIIKQDSDSSGMSLTEKFKSYFDEYRSSSNLFVENERQSSDNSLSSSNENTSEKTEKSISKLERQLKDLIQEMESIMNSNLPDTEKEPRVNEIQKKISELQSQINAYKQTLRASQTSAWKYKNQLLW